MSSFSFSFVFTLTTQVLRNAEFVAAEIAAVIRLFHRLYNCINVSLLRSCSVSDIVLLLATVCVAEVASAEKMCVSILTILLLECIIVITNPAGI